MEANQRVDEGAEVRRAAGNEPRANPPDREHCGMVIDMQEGHLIVLLSEDENNLHEFELKI